MKFHRIVFLFLCFYLHADETELKLTVNSTPELPVPNLFLSGDFEETDILKLFMNSDKSGESITVSNDAVSGRQSIQFHAPFQKGQLIYIFHCKNLKKNMEYSVSIMGKPSEELRSGATFGGLGASVGVIRKGNAKSETVLCRVNHVPGEPVKWRRAVSKPFMVPEDVNFIKFIFNIAYASGKGVIDDFRICQAYAVLHIKASSPAGIRQIVVTGENGQPVFDSGIFADQQMKVVSQDIKLSTQDIYKIRVLDYEGDVRTITYPKVKN